MIRKGTAVLIEGAFSKRKCFIEDLKDLNSISRKVLVSSVTSDKPLFGAPLPMCGIRVESLRSCQQVCVTRTTKKSSSFMYYANGLRSIVIPGL